MRARREHDRVVRWLDGTDVSALVLPFADQHAFHEDAKPGDLDTCPAGVSRSYTTKQPNGEWHPTPEMLKEMEASS